MMHATQLRVLLAASWLILAGASACFASGPCPSAEAAGEPDEKLEHLGAAIQGEGPIDILSIGSPAPAGPEGGPSPDSLSAQFVNATRAALPNRNIRLRAIGGRGLTAADMLVPLKASLAANPVTLVLWQTGTVEAVKGLPPDEFSDALGEAAANVHAAGADLILIDPQFSRFLRANADVEPYEEVMRQTAALPAVLLFRRFDLMHAWVDEGSIDLERVDKAEREAAVRSLYRCLGEALARYALLAAAEQPPKTAPDDVAARPAR